MRSQGYDLDNIDLLEKILEDISGVVKWCLAMALSLVFEMGSSTFELRGFLERGHVDLPFSSAIKIWLCEDYRLNKESAVPCGFSSQESLHYSCRMWCEKNNILPPKNQSEFHKTLEKSLLEMGIGAREGVRIDKKRMG